MTPPLFTRLLPYANLLKERTEPESILAALEGLQLPEHAVENTHLR